MEVCMTRAFAVTADTSDRVAVRLFAWLAG
jgi:hypothetical protein